MITLKDEELMISLVEKGDLSAFEELLKRYEKPLFGYISKYMNNFHIAQDLFQETFYRIFKHRKSFNNSLSFSTWAYRIATNVCINELKTKARELEVSLEDNSLGQEPSFLSKDKKVDTISHNPSPEEHSIKKDLEEKIRGLALSLPEKLKSVFILSEYQGLSCHDIANILEIPIGTVKSRLHNSFRHLLDLMEQKGLIDELQ